MSSKEIELIKGKVDIVDYISRYVNLKKAGTNYKGLCPFHSEKTPSFMVSPELQIFKCFGCGKAGDVITFVQEMEGLEFKDAIKKLAEEVGVKLNFKYTTKNIKKDNLEEINKITLKFYQYILKKLPAGEKARKYLKKRGLTKKQIEEFGLGYAPKDWDTLYRFLKSKGYKTEKIETLGLIKQGKNGFYDTYRGRIIFPLYDETNKLVGFSGRTLYNETPKYINTKNTPLFKKSKYIYNLNKAKTEIKKERVSIVVEGEFDVITPYIKGIKNIVALKGTAFTIEQAKLLKRYAPKTIIFFDNDIAGNEAALRGIEIAQREDLEVNIAILKNAKDPDEAATKSIDILHKAIEEAIPIYDYYFKFILSKESLETAFGKKRIVEFLMPKINRIPDSIVKAHYIKKLSEILGIDEQSLINREYSKIYKVNIKEKDYTKKKQEPAKKVLLSYLLWSDIAVFKNFYKQAVKVFKNNPKLLEILEEKKQAGDNKKKLLKITKYKKFIKEVFLQNMESFEINKEGQKTIISRIIKKIEREQVRQRLNQVILKIKEAEKKGNTEKLVKLQKKVKILTKRLSKLNQ